MHEQYLIFYIQYIPNNYIFILEDKMSNSGQGAVGGEGGSLPIRPENQPVQRHGLSTRRIREDLHNVVRSDIFFYQWSNNH